MLRKAAGLAFWFKHQIPETSDSEHSFVGYLFFFLLCVRVCIGEVHVLGGSLDISCCYCYMGFRKPYRRNGVPSLSFFKFNVYSTFTFIALLISCHSLHTHRSFLLNASDKAERDAWIEAIVQATPQKKEKETAAVPPLSTSVPTVRRDAVDVAAVVGVGNSHNEDEETVTNMDASILPSAEEMAGVDQIANQFLKPQSNATNYDSDGESPAPEDLVYAEEQAVMVFDDDGDGDDDDDSDDGDAIEIVVQRVVQIGCETAVEPLETEKRTFEPSEVSWCSADGCNLTQDKGITYSINVASTYGCSSSHNSDTSDSCGEDDETKVQETDSKRHEGSKESDDDKGSKETKTNSPLDENQRGIEQAGTLLESPKNDAGEVMSSLYYLEKVCLPSVPLTMVVIVRRGGVIF